VSKRGVSSSFFSSPSPFKERGIKGVRLPDKTKAGSQENRRFFWVLKGGEVNK
jgi:hypothetical protein